MFKLPSQRSGQQAHNGSITHHLSVTFGAFVIHSDIEGALFRLRHLLGVPMQEVIGTILQRSPLEIRVYEISGKIGVEQHHRQSQIHGTKHVQMLLVPMDAQCGGIGVKNTLQSHMVLLVMRVDHHRMTVGHQRQSRDRGSSRLGASRCEQTPGTFHGFDALLALRVIFAHHIQCG